MEGKADAHASEAVYGMSDTTRTSESERARVGTGALEKSAGSTLQGDRACTGCGFNLLGQPIVREGHYGLLIARCPECGAVAPLTEYPSISKWSRRIVGVVAALWLVALIAVTVGAGSALFGMTIVSSQEASQEFARSMESAYSAEVALQQQGQQASGGTGAGATTPTVGGAGQGTSSGPAPPLPPLPAHVRVRFSSMQAPQSWVEQQDVPERFLEWGGWVAVGNEVGIVAMPLCIVALAAGLFLGVAVLNQRRGGLLVVGLLPLAVCAAFHGLAYAGRSAGSFSPSEDAAMSFLWWRITLVGGIAAGVMLLLGVWFARPIARAFVRLMLPPRLRVPMYPLWEADGLPPPTARRVSRPSA